MANAERIESNPYVIAGAKEGEYLKDLQKPWRRVRKTAGLGDAVALVAHFGGYRDRKRDPDPVIRSCGTARPASQAPRWDTGSASRPASAMS